MASEPASGSGQEIKDPVYGPPHEESHDAATAAAEPPPPPPAPPVEDLQGRVHERPSDGGRSPSPAAVEEAAVDRKGKNVAPTSPSSSSSPPRSAGISSRGRRLPPASPFVSVSEGEESSIAETVDSARGVMVAWKEPVAQQVVAVRMAERPFDLKNVFEGILQEQMAIKEEEWAEEEEMKGQTINMRGIIKHYGLLEMVAGQGKIFHLNALLLCRAYSGFRPVLGDGECFYRSFIFSYLEQVLDRQDTHEHRLLAAVKEVGRQHARLGSEFSKSRKAFKMIKKIMRWKRHGRWKRVPTTNSYRRDKLLQFFSGYDTTEQIFAFLRLVTAIWMFSHLEEYEPCVSDLREDYTPRDVGHNSNALYLCRAYSEFRPVLGDTECFHMSFIFLYLGQIVDRQDTQEAHRLLSAVKEVARQHSRLGWISEFSNRRKAFEEIIMKVVRWKRHNIWKNVPTTDSYRRDKLLQFFSGYDTTDQIFAFLRLVTTIWICSHQEEYGPCVSDLREDSNVLLLWRAYSGFRPVLGDGECFYRSFIFSYPEQVLDRQEQDTHEEHRLLAAVRVLEPPRVHDGSYISSIASVARVSFLLILSEFYSVLRCIVSCCFGKRKPPKPPVPEHSWLSMMGSPIINDDGSCTIAAATMCIEAQHRLAFERVHGRGSFPFKAKAPSKLKRVCYGRLIWNSDDGASMTNVLQAIIDTGGIPTTRVPNDIKLPIDDFRVIINNEKFTPNKLARLLYIHGPIIGRVWADEKTYFDCVGDLVYRERGEDFRIKGTGEYHVAVCFAYKYDSETREFRVRIMDNHAEDGPLRWVSFSSFTTFYIPIVTKPIGTDQISRKNKKKRGPGLLAKISMWVIEQEVRRYRG